MRWDDEFVVSVGGGGGGGLGEGEDGFEVGGDEGLGRSGFFVVL